MSDKMSDMNERIGTVEVARRTGYSARQIQRRAAKIPGARRTAGGHYTFAFTEELAAWIKAHGLLPRDVGKRGRKKRLLSSLPINQALEPELLSKFLSAVAVQARVLIKAGDAETGQFAQSIKGDRRGSDNRRFARGCDALWGRYEDAGLIQNQESLRTWKTIKQLSTLDNPQIRTPISL